MALKRNSFVLCDMQNNSLELSLLKRCFLTDQLYAFNSSNSADRLIGKFRTVVGFEAGLLRLFDNTLLVPVSKPAGIDYFSFYFAIAINTAYRIHVMLRLFYINRVVKVWSIIAFIQFKLFSWQQS